ncbi:hypothetical protein [Dyella monticola]|uniref:hypothetical protein n=1 Tax=Dyella monticola TaxID=1927958 RepID=UPI0011C0491D|nr:hypothetical protein [Dyella monticola]
MGILQASHYEKRAIGRDTRMKLLSRLLRRRKADNLIDALHELRERLGDRVSTQVLAQAEARMLRRVAQGCSPSVAARLVITWALCADHGEQAS